MILAGRTYSMPIPVRSAVAVRASALLTLRVKNYRRVKS